MKKIRLLSLGAASLAAVGTVLALASCGSSKAKFGFIFLHDENSTYDKNFIDATKEACDELDVEFVSRTQVPETSVCKDKANDLVNEGCVGIFADSFAHEEYLLEVAKQNPDVQFAHATGYHAHTEKLDNFHNAFANIYEGRYLAGVAGLKLNEMIANNEFSASEAKIGYVGAYDYAEVISGYTSFYLGAKSQCPTVTMDVKFTNSWFTIEGETATAESLINGGAKLISQHADSMGAPGKCQERGVPNVSYNGSNDTTTYLVASRINWKPYFKYFIQSVLDGTEMSTDYVGTFANGDVELLDINMDLAAANTLDVLNPIIGGISAGSIRPFDTNTFTVNGQKVTSFDVEGQNVIKNINGVTFFDESSVYSAPYFSLNIDGINILS